MKKIRHDHYTEVGQTQMWAAQYYKYSLRALHFMGGWGHGHSGCPRQWAPRLRVGNAGHRHRATDSIQMNIQELATISINQIPLKSRSSTMNISAWSSMAGPVLEQAVQFNVFARRFFVRGLQRTATARQNTCPISYACGKL